MISDLCKGGPLPGGRRKTYMIEYTKIIMGTENTTVPQALEENSVQDNLKSTAKELGKSLLLKASDAAKKPVSTGLESVTESLKQNGPEVLGEAVSNVASGDISSLKATAAKVGLNLLQGKNAKSVAWGLVKQTPAFRIASIIGLVFILLLAMIIVLIIVL